MRQVTAAIIEKNGSILLARRAPSSKLAGMWEFPGGKIEEGESPEECLVRELREELGIETSVHELLAESVYHYEHGCFQILAYRSQIHAGEIELRDHDQVAFVPVLDLLSYALLPADIPIAEAIQKRLVSNS
jgi:8-oxo-dGTP diphosphatase